MDIMAVFDRGPRYAKLCGRLCAGFLLLASSGCGDAVAEHDSGAPTLLKSNIYKVTGSTTRGRNEEGDSIVFAVAACADDDDILLNGGCRFEPSGVPADPISLPQHNDDLSQPAQWFCQIRSGEVTAEAFCLTIGLPL